MADFPAAVTISEEGPREGFQIEPGPIPTDAKVALIDALSRTGLREIQVASFVSPDRVPGMADADELVRRITPVEGVAYTALWFNRMGLDRARASGRLTLAGKIRAYGSRTFLKRNLNRLPEQHADHTHREIENLKSVGVPITEGSVTAAFGCNFEGEVPVARVLEEIAWIMRTAEEHAVTLEILSLADTMAWATPEAIKRVVGAVRDRYPEKPVSLHLHDTRGMGIANAYAGLQMGVAAFDSAIGGLGGCPFAAHRGAAGNVSTEDFVFLCEESGVATGVDLDALIECARLAETLVGHPLPGCIMKGGSLRPLRRAA